MSQITKEELTKYAYAQIIHVSKYGCNGIKCKNCVMNRICDHFPSHSKDVALQMITYAKNYKEEK